MESNLNRMLEAQKDVVGEKKESKRHKHRKRHEKSSRKHKHNKNVAKDIKESKKEKKYYSSDELSNEKNSTENESSPNSQSSSHYSSDSENEDTFRRKKKKNKYSKSKKKHRKEEKKSRHQFSSDESLDDSGSDDGSEEEIRREKRKRRRMERKKERNHEDDLSVDKKIKLNPTNQINQKSQTSQTSQTRSEAGLDWMTSVPEKSIFELQEDKKTVEKVKVNANMEFDDPDRPFISDRELNPHFINLKKKSKEEGEEDDDEEEKGRGRGREGKGYNNSNADSKRNNQNNRLGSARGSERGSERGNRFGESMSGVGDGGASWRMKAIQRSKERAEREGKSFDEVYGDRWGSADKINTELARENPKFAKRQNRDFSFENSSHRGMRMPKGDTVSWKRFEKTQNDYKHLSSSAEKDKNDNIHHLTSANDEKYDDDYVELRFDKKEEKINVFDVEKEKKENKTDDTKNVDTKINEMSLKKEDEMSLNQISAKIMKFKLMGKLDEAKKLQDKLEEMKKEESKTEIIRMDEMNTEGNKEGEKEIIILPSINSKGNINYGVKNDESKYNNINKSFDRYNYDHSQKKKQRNLEKQRYFEDDDDLNLKEMVLKQKLGGMDDDYDQNYVKNIINKKNYKENRNVDDEYDFDDGIDMFESKEKKKTKNIKHDQESREKNKQVLDFKRSKSIYDRCHYCFDNDLRNKNLTISIANHTYLMLSPFSYLVNDYCYIISFQHEGSMRNAEDEVWDEVRNFKKCFLQMQGKKGKNVLFVETALGISKFQKRHRLVEAIPIPSDLFQQAPIYFKKAIDEVEEEWSQHNSKRLIDTTKKGLKFSIPDNFPYFHVEFGLEGGYCHVIDNEMEFKPDFGRNVIFGMLEIDSAGTSKRHVSKNNWQNHQLLAKEFLKGWSPHDWTKMLD